MKKLLRFLLSVLFFAVSTGATQAQFVNRLKNAAERGVSRAIEKKVESEMEKMARRKLDRMFKDVYGVDPNDSASAEKINRIMVSLYEDVPVADSYDFKGYSVLEFTGQDEKGKKIDPFQMTSFISDNTKITGLQVAGESKKPEDTYTMIFDFEKNVSITLMLNEGKKMRMAYKYDYVAMGGPLDSDAVGVSDPENVTLTKTGNTKTIMGLPCDEYLIETDDATTNYWVTQTPLNSVPSFWSQNNPFLNSRMKDANPGLFNSLPTGNMMEAHVVNKKDKGKFDMVVTDLQPDSPQTFIMADYPSISASMK